MGDGCGRSLVLPIFESRTSQTGKIRSIVSYDAIGKMAKLNWWIKPIYSKETLFLCNEKLDGKDNFKFQFFIVVGRVKYLFSKKKKKNPSCEKYIIFQRYLKFSVLKKKKKDCINNAFQLLPWKLQSIFDDSGISYS